MRYTVNWDIVAIESFIAESKFILKKWNQKEVDNFEHLVQLNIDRISINPKIGIFNKLYNINHLVISKQTTLYYNFNDKTKIVQLYLFWNNSKNPNDLLRLLK